MKIFNSKIENKLRINILITLFNKPESLEKIYAIDFISLYGNVFDIYEKNLHGNNQLLFSEFTTRRGIVKISLNELVLEGLITPNFSIEGIKYSSTENGKLSCSKMKSKYSNDYKVIATNAINKYENKSDKEIISLINKKAILFLNKG